MLDKGSHINAISVDTPTVASQLLNNVLFSTPAAGNFSSDFSTEVRAAADGTVYTV